MTSEEPMRLVESLHLQEAEDGGALVIDDRTLTAAHLNQAARVLVEALREPRTAEDLVTVLAAAAGCDPEDAAAPVASFVDELSRLDWIEPSKDRTGTS